MPACQAAVHAALGQAKMYQKLGDAIRHSRLAGYAGAVVHGPDR